MNTKHTPHTKGPWSRDQYGVVVDASGNPVRFRSISIACSGPHVQEAEANTDLAAAAPDLLSVLQEVLVLIPDAYETKERALAAIEKATGASHVSQQ